MFDKKIMMIAFFAGIIAAGCSKTPSSSASAATASSSDTSTSTDGSTSSGNLKVSGTCVDPDLSQVVIGTAFTLCDGSLGQGKLKLDLPYCSDNLQQNCITTKSFQSADISGLKAENIKSAAIIAGVTGTSPARPADCTSTGQVGCVSTETYKAVDTSNLTASSVKKGVVFGDIVGTYPSSTSTLPGADQSKGLTSDVFNSYMPSEDTFEYWDKNGVRQTSKGDGDLLAKNIGLGVQILGVTGTLKTNCRNGALDAVFNYSGYDVGPVVDHTGLGDHQFDSWDTIDDYGNGTGFPQTAAGAWTSNYNCSGSTFSDVTSTYFSSGESVASASFAGNVNWTAMFFDEQSKLYISSVLSSGDTWANGLAICSNLNTLSKGSTWRLPTQKELMTLYTNGIYAKVNNFKVSGTDYLHTLYFWSSSTVSTAVASGWVMNVSTGEVKALAKTSAVQGVLCVR